MKINEYIKNKTLYFVLSLVLLIVLSVSSSYAFMNSKVNEKVVENDLTVSYSENVIDSYLKTDIIKVENNTKEKKHFTLYATSVDDDKSLSIDKISYSINDGIAGTLKNGAIYSGYLEKGEYINLNVDLWIEVDTLENDDQGKSIQINFEVK